MSNPRVSVTQYYSKKLEADAYAVKMEGTSVKLFMSLEDLEDLQAILFLLV